MRSASQHRKNEIPGGGRGPPPPPPGEPATRVLESMSRLLEQVQQAPRPPVNVFELFRRLNPKEFGATTDPFLAEVQEYVLCEYMSLRQGESYVAEFIRKFERGSHFVPMIARDADQKLWHFLDGLRPTLRLDVILMRPTGYDEATACAFQAEQALRLGLKVQGIDPIRGSDFYLPDTEEIGASVTEISVCQTASGKPIVFEAARHQQLPHVISCLYARKLMRGGCQAFLASIIHFEFTVMHFVLTYSPVIFMDPMNRVFQPYMDHFIIVFIDDILIYWKSRDEHSQHLRTVLQNLQDRRLYAKFNKCEFLLDMVAFLGHIVPQQSEGIRDWPVPKSMTEIRSFLGLPGYHRKFIQGFFSIAVPMTTLTKKNAKFIWGSEFSRALTD
ncbi:uncharacterized protein [Primulina eburnea]|uniref:uncharacterized protein n=1 Tax=Primulina eburnea TaxID=1245227 RepID=UPI003C6C414C